MTAATQAPGGPVLDSRAFDLLCLTMAVVLGVHLAHLPWWLGATLALMLAVRWWQRRQFGGRAPLLLKLALIGLLTAVIVLEYGTLFGREPGSALAVGLLVLKLLESERPRDARVAASFACFALMAALLFDQGMVATFVVGLGLLPALATLRALEPAQPRGNLPRALFHAVKLLLAAAPVALLAFLLVPRLNGPLWGDPDPERGRTGLSDRMSPGGFSSLLEDDSPALRVTFDGPPPPPSQRYFRAYVMWLYDGRGWEHARILDGDGRPRPLEPVRATERVHYRVDLEPGEQRVLPALGVPLTVPAGARVSADRELLAERPIHDPLQYQVSSALRFRLAPTLTPMARQLALALPGGSNPRARALASQWRARYGTDAGAIVKAALALFHDGGFSYTLQPAPLGHDAMDDFLFDTREGFCEHYASAFTVLMRAAGVPARVVTGYQGGYWNELGHYLLVRQSDAHAWSEVWLAGRGWVRVDPTAAVRPERVSLGAAAAAGDQLGWSRHGWLWGIRNRWDVVNRWWDSSVVGFDALRQRGLLRPFGIAETGMALLVALTTAGVALCVAIGLGWALRRRERPDALARALRGLEARLARQGVVRRAGEGPRDYLQRAARGLPRHGAAIEALMAQYLHLRYASDEPSPELLRRFLRAAREFRAGRMVK